MIVFPFDGSMENVSVTTRWPLTKTPNEPESISLAPAGLSFLSPAYKSAAPARTTTAPHRIRAVRVTTFLLATLVFAAFRGFAQGPNLQSPRPQFSERSFRPSPA